MAAVDDAAHGRTCSSTWISPTAWGDIGRCLTQLRHDGIDPSGTVSVEGDPSIASSVDSQIALVWSARIDGHPVDVVAYMDTPDRIGACTIVLTD